MTPFGQLITRPPPVNFKNYFSNMGLSGSFSNNFVDDDFESARELHQERMAELRRRQRAAEIRQV